MSKFYSAIFIEKDTGKVIYRLNTKQLNKYFWEKEKALKLEWLIKEKFYNKHEIVIKDYSGDDSL